MSSRALQMLADALRRHRTRRGTRWRRLPGRGRLIWTSAALPGARHDMGAPANTV